jgi:prepilin-type N-terminal cleavage/methylation domain-containing protein
MNTTRKAFSLLELLLVIFIVSLIYFIGFEGIEKRTRPPEPLTPLSIKKAIMRAPFFSGEGTLLCTDNCQRCYFRKSLSSPFEPYKGKIDLANAELYTIDSNDNLQSIRYGRYRDRKICLKFDIYRNGSSSQLIIQTAKGVYFLPSYFGAPQKTDSLQNAQELWLAYAHDLDDPGNFY